MASETSKLYQETQSKCSAHKFYEMLKYTLHHLPSIFPESYKSCDIIEGDGQSVGSVRLWKYVLPGKPELLECKEKAEVIDDENMKLVLDLYEGDHTDHYQCFVLTMQVVPKDEGSTVQWTIEYAKHVEGATDPHLFMEMYTTVSDRMDAHLLSKE